MRVGRDRGGRGRGRDRGAAWVSYAPLSLPVPTAPQFFMLVGPSPASGQGSLLLGGPLHAPAAGITLARSARKEIWVLGVSPLLDSISLVLGSQPHDRMPDIIGFTVLDHIFKIDTVYDSIGITFNYRILS